MAEKIYLISNGVNHKVYVGKTSSNYLSNRWGNHLYRARKGFDSHLYRAMRLYGFHMFEIKQIDEATTSEEANYLERLWIQTLKANDPDYGYNLTIGGDGAPHTEETKKKISALQMGRRLSDDSKAKLSAAMPSEKARAQALQAWKDGKYSNRIRSCYSKTPDISGAKQSESMKKAWASGKMTGTTGKKFSTETKAKMSRAQKLRWAHV